MATRTGHATTGTIGDDGLGRTPGKARSLADRGLARLSFDVPTEDAQRLVDTAAASGFNRVTTFIRAVRLLADLDKHAREGGEILLIAKDGTRERLRLL